MIWTPKQTPPRDLRQWHRHFALVPVVLVDGRRAWLQFVERRLTNYCPYTFQRDWEYRA